MDQIKIGKFIAEERKRLGLTQRELADRLFISDKTVSKWERGRGLPEVALMMPLCEILSISANELLNGERIATPDYYEKAEETIVTLCKEKEAAKKKFIVAIIIVIASLIIGVSLCLIAGYVVVDDWVRYVLIGISIAIIFGGCMLACYFDNESGIFECKHCGEKFVPTLGAYIMGIHTPTRRYLKCPHCNKKSWCKQHRR